MNKIFTMALGILVAGLAMATDGEHFKSIGWNELSTWIQKKDPALVIYDVNTADTRKEIGVIPGAKLLSSAKKFDVTKELPADRNSQLVFYCANTQCMASHHAAEKAYDNGYHNVSVMVDGIQGWKKAGQKTTKI